MRWLKLCVLVGCIVAGCERKIERTEMVPLEQVPEAAMKAAKEKLPDVKFESAWKTKDGNYEVRGKAKNGRVRDLQVTDAGKVVEVD
jgi:hypothetical protein